jgi:molybdenum cofactor cytidylyltransferase
LIPGDHPTLNPGVVRLLLDCGRATHGKKSIIIPTYEEKRGHPTLIGWKHVASIRALAKDQGINSYLRRHPEETLEVPVDAADVLFDLDTPEDYQKLLDPPR